MFTKGVCSCQKRENISSQDNLIIHHFKVSMYIICPRQFRISLWIICSSRLHRPQVPLPRRQSALRISAMGQRQQGRAQPAHWCPPQRQTCAALTILWVADIITTQLLLQVKYLFLGSVILYSSVWPYVTMSLCLSIQHKVRVFYQLSDPLASISIFI